jgi:hypothetical protein
MKQNLVKLVFSFTRETNVLELSVETRKFFYIGNGLCQGFDCKLHFHHHVDFIFSYAMKLLFLIRKISFSFSTIQKSTDVIFCLGQI